jgi:oligosaccharide reducing-end xylanase
MIFFFRFLLMVLAVSYFSGIFLHAQEKQPGQGKGGAFYTRQYRNLFKENGASNKAIKEKIDTSYKQLFFGDSHIEGLYVETGKNSSGKLAYIRDLYNKDIRSEGMSYGMMITLQMNKKASFDALWNYALSNMYIETPGHPYAGYFSWSLKYDGTKNAEGPASDGEEYFVTALYFAANRWGNGKGIYNYQAWADKILRNMRHHKMTTGNTAFGMRTAGPMVDEKKKMILFVPAGNEPSFTDPSYHLPAFYEIWARVGPLEDRKFWAAAADSSRSFFHKATNPATGLASDYADFNGDPLETSYNPHSHHFAYDSWRTAMNWSVDWAWWHKDPAQQDLSNRIQAFFAKQGMPAYGSIFTTDGSVVNTSPSSALVATNATTSLAANQPVAKEFVKALWNQPLPSAPGERYYGGLLHLMSLLHCSGNFKIYASS